MLPTQHTDVASASNSTWRCPPPCGPPHICSPWPFGTPFSPAPMTLATTWASGPLSLRPLSQPAALKGVRALERRPSGSLARENSNQAATSGLPDPSTPLHPGLTSGDLRSSCSRQRSTQRLAEGCLSSYRKNVFAPCFQSKVAGCLSFSKGTGATRLLWTKSSPWSLRFCLCALPDH